MPACVLKGVAWTFAGFIGGVVIGLIIGAAVGALIEEVLYFGGGAFTVLCALGGATVFGLIGSLVCGIVGGVTSKT